MPDLSRRAFLVGSVGLLAACSSTSSVPRPAGPVSPPQLTTARIVTAINGVRQRHGRPPLNYSKRLEDAARSQAKLMASRDRLSHDLGASLRQRVSAVGYTGAVGENVAGGQRSLEQAIDGWLASPGHRDTLLSDRCVEFGLAVEAVPAGRASRYGLYWAFIAGGDPAAWQG